MSESPNEFDAHCSWLLKEMQKWEDSQTIWDKNSRRRMNYHFRKEIDKNSRLVKKLAKEAIE